MKANLLLKLLFSGSVLFAGCGRYLPPVAPERLAAREVRNLEVTADAEGVLFSWKAPVSDRRGEELKYLAGYRIFRIPENEISWFTTSDSSDTLDIEAEEYEIAFIPDTHLALLEQRREEARASGKLVRRVSLTDEEITFKWNDKAVETGLSYIYYVVPENHDETRGNPGQLVRVLFHGTDSQIQLLKQDVIKNL